MPAHGRLAILKAIGLQFQAALKGKRLAFSEGRSIVQRRTAGRNAYAFSYSLYRSLLEGSLFRTTGKFISEERRVYLNRGTPLDRGIEKILNSNDNPELGGFYAYAIEIVVEKSTKELSRAGEGQKAIYGRPLKSISLISFDPAITDADTTLVFQQRTIPPNFPFTIALLWRRGEFTEEGHSLDWKSQ
ncbi:MAG: hypothetical protein JWQ49_2953 [Edaphobacter sp.]|nr:hypothetical protein [Edaphobacter sp.]